MASSILPAMLAQRTFVVAPGLQDMVAAVLAREIGFEVVYGSGYWLTASALGLPDAGIASVTQFTDRMAALVATSGAAVIADADTGFGGLLNVHHTVRAYEAAGVAAIQIEDQEFPKRCGHSGPRPVISTVDMARKVAVAADARSSADFLIVARTDARQSEGLDAVMHRLEAFSRGGADVLFPEALETADEMRRVTAAFDLPVMANMAHGGRTPMMPPAELEDLGFAIGIYPSLNGLAAAAAMAAAMRRLRGGEVAGAEELFDFRRFSDLIGLDRVREFEARWAEPELSKETTK